VVRACFAALLTADGKSPEAELPRAELVFADHPLVPVYLVFDAILRRIALPKEQANDFKTAFGGMLDAALREKFHCLADTVFVF
jgi:hypothetical protein